MKGLKEYMKVHGHHFTDKLAADVTRRSWDITRIRKSAQKHVYYNVTGSTDGDMLYLMDMFWHFLDGQYTYGKGMRLTLLFVGDYFKTGFPFNVWLSDSSEDFDLTPYI